MKRSNFYVCSNESCLTPDKPIIEKNLGFLNNKPYCMFCYSQLLAQITEKKVISRLHRRKTKIVPDRQNLTRIKPRKTQNEENKGSTSRIPLIMENQKENQPWSTILTKLAISKQLDFGKILSISKHPKKNGWTVTTASNTNLYLSIELSPKRELIKKEILVKLNNINLDIYHETINNSGSQLRFNSEKTLLVHVFKRKISFLDDFDFENLDKEIFPDLARKFGQFIYKTWFFGFDSDPFSFLLIFDSEKEQQDSINFFPWGHNNQSFASGFIEQLYNDIAIKFPLILDYLDEFLDGLTEEKEILTKLLKDESFLMLIKSYFEKENNFSGKDIILANVPPFYR